MNEKTGREEYGRTENSECPTIRQRVDGRWKDVPVGSEWMVPYNLYLLMEYDCHICVDIVTASLCVKYLLKYATQGSDMAKARVRGYTNGTEQDLSTHYISATEVTWRLFNFFMLSRSPAVTQTHAHLGDEHNVPFPDTAIPGEHFHRADDVVTDLMCYFN